MREDWLTKCEDVLDIEPQRIEEENAGEVNPGVLGRKPEDESSGRSLNLKERRSKDGGGTPAPPIKAPKQLQAAAAARTQTHKQLTEETPLSRYQGNPTTSLLPDLTPASVLL